MSDLTPKQRESLEWIDAHRKTVELLEKNGLADPQRMEILGEMVAGAAAWGTLRKWAIQWGAALGALGTIVAAVAWLRGWWNGDVR